MTLVATLTAMSSTVHEPTILCATSEWKEARCTRRRDIRTYQAPRFKVCGHCWEGNRLHTCAHGTSGLCTYKMF